MPLLKSIQIRRASATSTIRVKRKTGEVLLELTVNRPVQPGDEQPLPVDVWVPDRSDIVVEAPPDGDVMLDWDQSGLETLRLVQLLRRIPPHERRDYVRYPALIAMRIVDAGWGRLVGPDEEAELDSPRLYIPHGIPHTGARRD